MDEIRVMICDDHALFRRGLVMALEDAADIEVVAEAAGGDEAIESAIALTPDVVLMDVRMPGTDGIAALRRLVEDLPGVRVVMLSVDDDDEDLFEAIKAGAAGYVLKERSIEEVVEAVRAVAIGHSLLSPSIARALIDEFARLAATDRSRTPGWASPRLTARELDVLRLVADGQSNSDVAEQLGLTENAAKNHVRNILEKLQLYTRTEAVLYAVREHLIEP